ncbi:hypothetical protein BY996DRAFT_672777 [Phakopsora pachyrhizi]|nr:hypothetical protein BY996DRAFT_672777 [Phakopsora pachyrhizi]
MESICLEFSGLHDRYFATAPDDTSTLGFLSEKLQHARERVKAASRSGLLTPLEATTCASIASNIEKLSSCVIKSSHAIEDLCAEFSKKSHIFSPSLGTPSEPSLAVASCTSRTSSNQGKLKEWCRSHFSYLFPTDSEVAKLSTISKMSENQVSSWFRNARTRSGWSKLYADKIHVNRDPIRLEIVFQDYHSYILLHCQSDIREHISRDEHFRLVDKVWHWFQIDKKCKKPEDSGAVRPWVKTVLFEALQSSKESCNSDIKLKEAPSFSGFGELPQISDQPFFPKLNPSSDIEETASESYSSTNYRCSTISYSSCESVSGSSSDQPMSSTSHHVTTPSSSILDFTPSFNSYSSQPSSPSIVSSDLSTPESQDYPSPPDLNCLHQLSPPSLFSSQTSNPVEIINGLDALFQLDYSSDSLRDFAMPSSSSTNSQETSEFESGQFDDASED